LLLALTGTAIAVGEVRAFIGLALALLEAGDAIFIP
jgi:hypothetical protein